jgi:hypothetical protein
MYCAHRHVYIRVFIKWSGQHPTRFFARCRLLYDVWSKFFNFLDGTKEEWEENRKIYMAPPQPEPRNENTAFFADKVWHTINISFQSPFFSSSFLYFLLLLPSSSSSPFYTNHFNVCELQTALWYWTTQKGTWTSWILSDLSDLKLLQILSINLRTSSCRGFTRQDTKHGVSRLLWHEQCHNVSRIQYLTHNCNT